MQASAWHVMVIGRETRFFFLYNTIFYYSVMCSENITNKAPFLF